MNAPLLVDHLVLSLCAIDIRLKTGQAVPIGVDAVALGGAAARLLKSDRFHTSAAFSLRACDLVADLGTPVPSIDWDNSSGGERAETLNLAVKLIRSLMLLACDDDREDLINDFVDFASVDILGKERTARDIYECSLEEYLWKPEADAVVA